MGYVYDIGNTIRSLAWTVRQKALAAVTTPDAQDAQKAYYTYLTNATLAVDEGRMKVVNGAFPPPDPTNADGRYGCANKTTWYSTDPLWCSGRYLLDQGRANPVGFPHWTGSPTSCTGCRRDLTSGYSNPWMTAYAVLVYGWLIDLGFPAAKPYDVTAKYMMGLFMDSGGINGPLAATYHTPMSNPAGDGYIQTWAGVSAAHITSARVARAFDGTANTFLIAEALNGNQAQNIYNLVDLWYYAGGSYFRVGNEIMYLHTTGYATVGMTVNTTTDRATVASHAFLTGDLIRAHRDAGAGNVAALSVTDGGSMCMYGKTDCDFYVKVIDATTLELYLDSGLTQLVDWTAADSGLYAGQTASTSTAIRTTDADGWNAAGAAGHGDVSRRGGRSLSMQSLASTRPTRCNRTQAECSRGLQAAGTAPSIQIRLPAVLPATGVADVPHGSRHDVQRGCVVRSQHHHELRQPM